MDFSRFEFETVPAPDGVQERVGHLSCCPATNMVGGRLVDVAIAVVLGVVGWVLFFVVASRGPSWPWI